MTKTLVQALLSKSLMHDCSGLKVGVRAAVGSQQSFVIEG